MNGSRALVAALTSLCVVGAAPSVVRGQAEIDLLPVDSCLDASESQLVVEVYLASSANDVWGGQFLLSYDTARLDFVSADPGDAPFTLEVHEAVDEGTGTIAYAAGVGFGGVGTTSPTVMARLTFNVLSEFCATSDLVAFRGPNAFEQPTRLTDENAVAVAPVTFDLGPVQNDDTPPALTIPPDITVNADAGHCDVMLAVGTGTAVDNCTPMGELTVVGVRSDSLALNQPYLPGTTMITWSTADACGNEATGVQTIIVAAFNTVQADLKLAAVDPAFFSRCITFEVYPTGGGAPVVVNKTVPFVSGLGTAFLDVPCGSYDCITARDDLHTLASTDDDDFGIFGAVYVADFTNAGSMDNDFLVGGDVNADGVIDILDFGVFIGQFGLVLGASTPCGTAPYHADIDGDGIVGIDDFSFIQINFGATDELDCSPGPIMSDESAGSNGSGAASPARVPRMSISVAELRRLGLEALASADLNGDGVVDQGDMSAFILAAHTEEAEQDVDENGGIGVTDMRLVIEGLGMPLSDR